LKEVGAWCVFKARYMRSVLSSGLVLSNDIDWAMLWHGPGPVELFECCIDWLLWLVPYD
jgi:hypothetical protein